MEKGGGKILFFVFLFTLGVILNLVFVDQVFCYDTNVAHPGIAGLAVKVYNKNNTKKITAEQYNWIKQGAVEEDVPTRWLNHFYDPVYNRGLRFITQHETSKAWAKDPVSQQSYSKGDKTWQRAINDYRSGDYESAFKELGHNIHLVSDLLVPAHTRDDIHAPKPDSYEEYVKNNWDNLSKNIDAQPIYKNSLENIFDEAANYSNNNFYSDGTIEDKSYKILDIDNLLKIDTQKGKIYIVKNNLNNEPRNLYITDNLEWKSNGLKLLNDRVILDDYSSHLLPKAVAYSAGTIKLFLDETQKNQTEKLPFFRSNIGGLVNSLAGKVIDVAENIYKGSASQADTNTGVINQTTDAVVGKIETIGKSLNKKVSKPSAKNSETSSPDLSSSEMVAVAPTSPVTPPAVVEKTISFPRPPVYSSGGGGSQSNSSNTVVEINLPSLRFTTTTVSATSTFTNSEPSPTSTVGSEVPISSTTTTTTTATDTTNTSPTSTDAEISDLSTSSSSIPVVETSSTSTTSTYEDPDLVPTPTSTVVIEESVATSTSPTTSVSTSTDSSATSIVVSTSTVPVTVAIPDVVISEVAWAGTSQFTSEDEYIEFYNNSDQDIVLFPVTNTQKWWKLKISGKEITINKINNSIIPAHGYYLLENPDDRTANEIGGDVIYSGVMSDTGESLQLFDSVGNLVDEVNSSAGWFAGSKNSYSSMEKINSDLLGNISDNWQTNQGPRFVGKVDGGGDALPLNGSPKQSNFGSIVLRATQVETERTLKKSDFPYILTYYEVPVGKTLNVEKGAIVKAYYPDSRLEIKGTINVLGSSDEKAVFTSDNQSAKSWQGLMFYAGSSGNISGLDMTYAGKSFKLPNANMWDPKYSYGIYSNSTNLNISNSNFSDNGDTDIYNSNSNASISNTSFKNGITALEHRGGDLNLDNITVDNFSNPTGAIYVKDIWPKLNAINFSGSTNGAVNIGPATITSSVRVGTAIPINLENFTIESTGSLTVDKGVTFKLPQYSNIFIKGVLNLNGTEDEPVKFVGPEGPNKYWGHLVFDGGKGNLNSVDFSGGGYNSPGDSYKGVVSINNNSQVSMENCQLIDNRLPVEIIQINDSNVNLNNTSIGYTSKDTFFPNVKGVQINGGSLSINNSFFYNLTIAITAGSVNPLPTLSLNNMDARNFINVDSYLSPSNWFPAFTASP